MPDDNCAQLLRVGCLLEELNLSEPLSHPCVYILPLHPNWSSIGFLYVPRPISRLHLYYECNSLFTICYGIDSIFDFLPLLAYLLRVE